MQDFDLLPDEIEPVSLSGPRILLRPLTERDATQVLQVIGDSRAFLSRHLPWPSLCETEEDILSRIDAWDLQAQMGSGACFGVFLGEQFLGCMIIGWIQRDHLSAQISYWLGEKFTGKGYATEALELLVDYAFQELHLNRLEISCSVTNLESMALVRRLKFQEEGKSRDFERINGIFEDHIRFARLARD